MLRSGERLKNFQIISFDAKRILRDAAVTFIVVAAVAVVTMATFR